MTPLPGYRPEFLSALGAWQRGWQEDPQRRRTLAAAMREEVRHLPSAAHPVAEHCYRKRFLYTGELGLIVLADNGLDEGPASWTTLPKFAHQFHGYHRSDAVCAAIFAHRPSEDEVLVDIAQLWRDEAFRRAVDDYAAGNGPNADALVNFKADQGEIVLCAPLHWTEIVGLCGIGSSFDEIADSMGLVESARTPTVQALMDASVFPGEPTWVWNARARGILSRARDKVIEKINAVLEGR